MPLQGPLIDADASLPLLLGRGYDSLQSRAMADGVEDQPVVTELGNPAASNGQDVVYELREIVAASQLRSTLNVSVSADFGGFGGGGSIASQFCQGTVLDSYSFYLMVSVKVLNRTETFRPYRLNDDALARSYNEDPQNYYETFGDFFVTSRNTGGVLLAIYEFNCSSQEEYQSLSVQASASGLFFSTSADFKSAFDRIDKRSFSSIRVHRLGGTGQIPDQTNFIEYSRNFPSVVASATGNPVVMSWGIGTYNLAVNQADHAGVPDLSEVRLFLGKLAKERDNAIRYAADIEYIRQHPAEFNTFDMATLQSAGDDAKAYLDAIGDKAQEVLRAPYTEPLQFAQRAPKVSLPARIVASDLSFTIFAPTGRERNRHRFTGGTALVCQIPNDGTYMEGFQFDWEGPHPGVECEYSVLVGGVGLMDYAPSGTFRGNTQGQHGIGGISLRLTGTNAKFYTITYSGTAIIDRDDHAPMQMGPVSDGSYLGAPGTPLAFIVLEIAIHKRTLSKGF